MKRLMSVALLAAAGVLYSQTQTQTLNCKVKSLDIQTLDIRMDCTGSVVTPPPPGPEPDPPPVIPPSGVTVTVIKPNAQETVAGTYLAVAQVTGAIAQLRFFVDGAPASAQQSGAPWDDSIGTTQYVNGDHTITAVATLAGGAVVSSPGVVFKIANAVSGGPTPPPVIPGPLPNPTPTPMPTGGNAWFAAPNGSATGTGSITSPWTLQVALKKSGVIMPGDTLWLRAGEYGNGFDEFLPVEFAGTAAKPIIIRNYNNERAIIGGWLYSMQPDIWFWGLEVHNKNANRSSPRGSDGITLFHGCNRCKAINNIVHDRCNSVAAWQDAEGAEVYGNILFNGGYQTDRGHCHGIYTQNDDGVKVLESNVIFNMFGVGIHSYGSPAAYTQHYRYTRNIVFNNGAPAGTRDYQILLAGAQGHPKNDLVLTENLLYSTPTMQAGFTTALGLQWDADSSANPGHPNLDVTMDRNVSVGGGASWAGMFWDRITGTGNRFYAAGTAYLGWLRLTGAQTTAQYNFDQNQYYGVQRWWSTGGTQSFDLATWRSRSGVDKTSTFTAGKPTANWVYTYPNRYEPGRGHVTIYNWTGAASVPVDLSSILTPGKPFEVRDVQNLQAPPVLTGTYSGPVSLPMTGLPTPTAPYGRSALAHTAPDFAVFLLLPK